ncbi:hypothetical protein CEXT_203091 [Caerostris extrusa]|uniref:Uncharacterized protein n=1 Tax=Caerostris extrusa TaxID=172846 RepID=A0AAV4XD39_CAEEX|nr:hypothetical protein CEXT_203091 [Caerostris extrusa]
MGAGLCAGTRMTDPLGAPMECIEGGYHPGNGCLHLGQQRRRQAVGYCSSARISNSGHRVHGGHVLMLMSPMTLLICPIFVSFRYGRWYDTVPLFSHLPIVWRY